MKQAIGVVVVIAMLMITGAVRQAEAADASIDAPVVSGYLFRGLLLNDEPVFQPMVTVAAANGFAFYTWANMPLTDQNMFGKDNDDAFEFSEVDLIIEYSHNLGLENACFSIGCAQYLYPDPTYEGAADAPPTRELYLVASYATFLSPTLSLYYDVDDNDGGLYGNLKISHGLDLNEKISLGAYASVGWANSDYNTYYVGYDDSEMADLNVGVNAGYQITDTVSASASVTYSTLLESDLERAAEAVYYNDDDTVVGSIGISFAF